MTDSPDATQPTHDRTPEHPTDVPDGVEAMRAMNPNSLMHRMGIEIVEASAQRLVATMHAGPGKAVVGLDINATHHRAARSGLVTGVATPISLGRTLACYEIVVTDDTGARTCTSRITCLIRDAAPGA